MYASLQSRHHVPYSWLFRWCARAGGAIVVTFWVAFVLLEIARSDVDLPSVAAYYQAAALVLVFAGYVLGWRKELTGGILAIIGTVAFFAVHVSTFGMLPGLEAAWFAAPGVLYLLAWISGDRNDEIPVSQK
jgi:hypothetical protein